MSFKYSIEEILDIEKSHYSYSLPPETVTLINQIRESLSAARKTKAQPQWEKLRQKKTVPTKAERVLDPVDELRSLLNKLSDKTYFNHMDSVGRIVSSVEGEKLQIVAEVLFDICSTNRFYSKLYADLYSALVSENTALQTHLKHRVAIILETFRHLTFVNEDHENYDALCRRNDENDRNRSVAEFLKNLNQNGLINDSTIIQTCEDILKSVLSVINEDNYDDSIFMAVDIIAILYDKSKMSTSKLDDRTTYNDCLEKFARSKKKQYKSLSSKTIFKLMDLIGI
jgi:hypothetical protein